MTEPTICIQPLSGALGAEVSGLDLSRPLGDGRFDEVHRAFLEYHVLSFPGQTLTPDQQIAFAARFGELDIYPYIKSIAGSPEVIEVLKTEYDTINFGGAWHSDTCYLEKPALGTMLYALETPRVGGDTMFADMGLAHDALSDAMKDMLDGLVGINSSAYGCQGDRAGKIKKLEGMKDKFIDKSEVSVASHPVVRTHPETGRRGLFVSRSHTARLEGMTEAESKPLLDFLCGHAVRPEFTCRVRWRPGMLVFWDNRCTQHLAINDYNGQRRRMHRVTLKGDRPV